MLHVLASDVIVRVSALVEELAAQHGVARHFAQDDRLVDGGFTSMAMVDLMLAIEAKFDLTIPQVEMTPLNFQSISTLAAMLKRI